MSAALSDEGEADRLEQIARELAEVGLMDWSFRLRRIALNVARVERLYEDHVALSMAQQQAIREAAPSGKVVVLAQHRGVGR